MTSAWEVLALALVMGVRHAFDADHLVAVSTIVSEYRNPLKAIWIGASWGLGHTTTLLLAGMAVLLLNLHMPERLAPFFELAVGVMLVFLGVQTFRTFRHRKVHIHVHTHPDVQPELHAHFHSHEASPEHVHHEPRRWETLGKLLVAGIIPGEHKLEGAKNGLRPFFRLKSYAVGTVHGLAGSAALMLLVLTGLRSTWDGLMYILIFGLGSVASMAVISIFISLPFSMSVHVPRLNRMVQIATGVFSIAFGLFLMYETGIAEMLMAAI
ncbi:MAG: hypothetical protein HYX79_10120 [Chloroflexi bacterium]|nr:hypothetical protein [Chloroflexota bacterium]